MQVEGPELPALLQLINTPVETKLSDEDEKLRSNLLKEPQQLLKHFLENVPNNEWLDAHEALAGHLFKDITDLIHQGSLPVQSTADVMNIIKIKYERLKSIISKETKITESQRPDVVEQSLDKKVEAPEKVLLVSRLVLIASGEYFRSFFDNSYKERYKREFSSEEIAHYIPLEVFSMIYAYLESGNKADLNFKDLDEPTLWNIVEQCHMWDLLEIQKIAESLLIKKVTNLNTAWESLSGALIFNMAAMRIHCMNIIAQNNLYISEKADHSYGTTITGFTKENLHFLQEFTLPVSSLSINDRLLANRSLEKYMSGLTTLDTIHLTITEDGLSSTAKRVLANLPKLRRLRIKTLGSYNPPLKFSKSPPELSALALKESQPENGQVTLSNIEQLDLRGLPSKPIVKRVILSIIAVIPGVFDIRLQGSGFVDEKFIENLARLPHLKGLKLLDLGNCMKLRDQSFIKLSKSFAVLEALNLHSCHIKNEGFWTLIHECQFLHDINISYCRFLGSGLFSKDEIKPFLARLTSLVATGLEHLSVEDFNCLLQNGILLEKLNLSDNPQFKIASMDSCQLPNLKEFHFSTDQMSDPKQLMMLNLDKFPSLKSLTIKGSKDFFPKDIIENYKVKNLGVDLSFDEPKLN